MLFPRAPFALLILVVSAFEDFNADVVGVANSSAAEIDNSTDDIFTDPDSVDAPSNATDNGGAIFQAPAPAPAVGDEQVASDPVKEVIRVLKALATRVDVRDRKENKIHEQFGDYCYHGVTGLEKSFKESQQEIPRLHLQVLELERKRALLTQGIKAHENDEANAKNAIMTATSIRQDEIMAHQKELQTLNVNREHLQELLSSGQSSGGTPPAPAPPPQPALAAPASEAAESLGDEGAEGSDNSSALMQTNMAALQKLTLSAGSTSELMALLQQPDATPAQGVQVLDMLKSMLEGVKRDIKEVEAQETAHEHIFNAMEKAKTLELKSLQRNLQEKKERDASYFSQLVNLKSEQQDTGAVVDDSQKLITNLKNWCGIRRKAHATMHQKVASQVQALQQAAKKLLSGEELEMFKPPPLEQTQPGPADTLVTFMQVAQRHDFSSAAASHHDTSAGRRALRGKNSGASGSGGIEKITKLVDTMIDVLMREQEDDDLEVQLCRDELQTTEEGKAAVEGQQKAKSADIATLAEQLETLERDVTSEKKAIKRVDWVVETATKLREKCHNNLATSVAQGAAAIDVMYKAKNSLENFLNEGGTLGTQQSMAVQDEFGFLTDTASAGPDPASTLKTLQDVISAVRAEIVQVKLSEATDQAAYEELLKVAKTSRRQDAYTLTSFVGGQAALTSQSDKITRKKKALAEQLGATDHLDETLHSECDKLLADYSQKKRARDEEITILKQKKEALEISLAGMDLR